MEASTRRHGIAGLTGFLVPLGLAWLLMASHGILPAQAGGDDAAPPLRRWERVRVKMEAGGELFAPTDGEGGEVRRPFTATARLDFLEALGGGTAPATDPATETDSSTLAAAPPHDACGVRHFFAAASELSIDRGDVTRRSLAPDTSTLIVSSSPGIVHFATDSLLTHEEAELLAIAFDPLLLDRLLPPADATSAEWRPSAELTAALLAIDTVGRPVDDPQSDSTGSSPDAAASGPLLVRVQRAAEPDGAAKLIVTGTVLGAVDGVPTTIRVDGSYELDALGLQVKSGIVRLHEKRLAGHVSPGFECDATFQMARRPADGSSAVPGADAMVLDGMKDAWIRVLNGQSTGNPRSLRVEDSDGRFSLVHDARWRPVTADARGLVLRMVDEGALLAECTVSPLPPGETGTPIDEFRRDVERSLGGRLGRFTASDEKAAEDGGRVLRVVCEGAIDGVPLEWRHYLVEGGQGSRTAVTFIVERRFADRFGMADADFIAGLSPEKGPAP